MKIFACCNWQLKFLGPIIESWKAEGHEVRYETGYNPQQHEWADLCFVDVCDNNAIVASRQRFVHSRLVIRAIDIECWVRQPAGVTWGNVDAIIFGAKHIEEMVRSFVSFPPTVTVAHVPFGVDLSKWSFRKRDGGGRRVALVAHRWSAKGLDMLLQVMAALGPGWRLDCLGTRSTEQWLHAYIDHIIAELGLEVSFTDRVSDVDPWLEDKDYLILASMKESFSYAAAEAAAKGIRPLIHNFWRAKDIWPQAWIWSTIDECVSKILQGPYDSSEYRGFIEKNYSLEIMMKGLNEVCQIP